MWWSTCCMPFTFHGLCSLQQIHRGPFLSDTHLHAHMFGTSSAFTCEYTFIEHYRLYRVHATLIRHFCYMWLLLLFWQLKQGCLNVKTHLWKCAWWCHLLHIKLTKSDPLLWSLSSALPICSFIPVYSPAFLHTSLLWDYPLMPNLNRGFEAGDCGCGCGGLTLPESDAFGDKTRDAQHRAGGCGAVYEAKGRTNGRVGSS